MNIIVCIKQVPGTTVVDIDEKTGVLKRSGVAAKMNPYDLYALETALRLAEQQGGTVQVLSMGPAQALDIIKEAYMMGADEGTLLSGAAFAGADTLATAYALAQAIRKLGAFDLIICGKQTTDGDTAQVGPELAEFLDLPHAANVLAIDSAESSGLTLRVDMTDYVQAQYIPFPCLLTVEKDIYMPRLPSYKRKLACAEKEVQVFGLPDLADTYERHYGLAGSPTQVERVFPPTAAAGRVTVTGNAEEQAEFIYQRLRELKFI